MWARRAVLRLLAAAAVLAWGRGRPAAAERVTVAVGSYGNIAFLPYDLAVALGYFAEQGLEVESQYLQSGTQASTAALAGGADFAAASLDHAVKAHLQGKALRMIASFSEIPGGRIVVRREPRDAVKGVKDLAGRPMGVTGLGASTHMILAAALIHHAGVAREKVNAVPVGYSGMVAAFENGKTDGLLAPAVPAATLVGSGKGFVLLDLMDRGPSEAVFGGPYQESGLLARADVVAERPEVCRRVVRAIVKANRWIATHTPEEIADRLPAKVVGDRALYVRALEPVHRGFSKTGRIEPRAVETIVRAHRAFGTIPAGREVEAAGLYDNRFVDGAVTAP